MSFLDLNPGLRFKVPLAPLVIALVGAGGTGSHLLFNLVKIVLHAQDIGMPPIKLVVIDGDTVERKNTRGRQFFRHRDIGHNKAEVLAARFNAEFGLKIVAVPEMASSDILRAFEPTVVGKEVGILVGAVDRPSGRRVLHQALRRGSWRLWIDSGNGRDGGQVCWGTATHKNHLHKALVIPGLCAEVPAPSLQFPKLLTLGEEAPVIDCGQRIALGEQSLLINMYMAGLAATYLHKMIIEREIDFICSTVSLDPPMTTTRSLTSAALLSTTKVRPSLLYGTPPVSISRQLHRRSLHRRTQRHILQQRGVTV